MAATGHGVVTTLGDQGLLVRTTGAPYCCLNVTASVPGNWQRFGLYLGYNDK
jgi:hypothetical protein